MSKKKRNVLLIIVAGALCVVGLVSWTAYHNPSRRVASSYGAFMKKTVLGQAGGWNTRSGDELRALRDQLMLARVPAYARDAYLRLVIAVDACIAVGSCQQAGVDIDELVSQVPL